MKKLDITAQKIVQHTLQSAMEGGPNCPTLWFYQPTAPKSRCPNRRTKSKSHAAVLSPVASQMRRAFLCLLLEKFTKSSNN